MSNSTKDDITFKDLVIKVKEWINYLTKKWKLILLLGLLGGIGGFFYAYSLKPIYTARLVFVLEEEKSGGGLNSALGLASQFGIDLGGGTSGVFSGGNLIGLMKSRSLIEKVLLRPINETATSVSFADYFLEVEGWRKRWTDAFSASMKFPAKADRTRFSIQQDSVLGMIYNHLLLKNIDVNQPDKKLSFITIQIKSGNELFAKRMSEVLIEEVSLLYTETKTQKSSQNIAILQRQTDSVRSALSDAISGVAQANDDIYNLNPSLNIKRVPSSKRQIDVQSNSAILTELVKNLEIAKLTFLKEVPLIKTIDKPILPLPVDRNSRSKAGLTAFLLTVFLVSLFLLLRKWWIETVQNKK